MEWLIFKLDGQKRPMYQCHKTLRNGPIARSNFRKPFWGLAPELGLQFVSRTEAVLQAVRTSQQVRCATYVCTRESAIQRANAGFTRKNGFSVYSGVSR